MLDYHTYLAHFGEAGVQAIIERIERYEHRRSADLHSLEARWNEIMNIEAFQFTKKAA
jgi:hypothetical protein